MHTKKSTLVKANRHNWYLKNSLKFKKYLQREIDANELLEILNVSNCQKP